MKKSFAILALLALASGSAFAQKKPAAKAPMKKAASPASASVLRGKSIYTQYCLSCHQADGGGVSGLNPPLIKTDYVLGPKPKLVLVLLKGLQGEDINGEPYHNVMPSQDFLTDQQIADVLTYVRNSFGNKASAVETSTVKDMRKAVLLK